MTARKREKGKGMPVSLPTLSSYRVEMRPHTGGRKRVLVCACDAILSYSHETIAFRHGRECVTVLGRELWCRVFGNRSAEVIGFVSKIVFGEEDAKQ